MLIPTDIMGIYQAQQADAFFVRDLRTGVLQPTPYDTLQEAVDAQTEAETPTDAQAQAKAQDRPASVLYIATKRHVLELAAEVAAYTDLLTHPMLNAPEARNV